MVVASFHDFLDTWAPLASWAVAVGTGALAVATWWLGTKARKEAQSVGDQADAVRTQVELERQQLEASQRPFVVPVTNDWEPMMDAPVKRQHSRVFGEDFEPWMMLSNAGAGPAYNTRGGLFWKGGIGGGWQLLPISIPAGRDLPAKLEVNRNYEVKWPKAVGYLLYSDLAGTEWQTHFRYRENKVGQLSVRSRRSARRVTLASRTTPKH